MGALIIKLTNTEHQQTIFPALYLFDVTYNTHIFPAQQLYELSTMIIPLLQIRNLRPRRYCIK